MNWSEKGGFHAYSPAALLKVTGEDAMMFLQGQFTNDLRKVQAEGAGYGLWLNQKGKVLADSFVVGSQTAGEFLLMSYFSESEVIRERLEAYVIADDVVIEDATAEWRGLSLIHVNMDDLRRSLPTLVTFSGRRMNSRSLEVLFPRGGEDAIHTAISDLGLKEISTDEMERLRIAEGIPAVPQDIGPGELPHEGGLEQVAISYTKGCYLGQEVMARLRSMGQVRRRLLRIRGDRGVVPTIPAPLFLNDRKVGELRSVAGDRSGGYAGLALLSLIHVKPDSLLSFEPGQPPRMRVVDAGFSS
jgi:tRNA-modifying protein YgfZ